MEIVMFIGIPATGKSSFYQERFAASHLRINRDMLKTDARTSSLFEWCLERKQCCVIDNTNTTRAVRNRWISPAREKGVPVIGYFFESKLEGALERNSQREGDARFRDAMVVTMKRLMNCGFRVRFAYAQSDEISLLFDPDEQLFSRKHRKWLSILAGEASAALSLNIGRHVVMDCRVIELPAAKVVVDYFRWRMEDAGRNCLNSHAYWILRKTGKSVAEATAMISGLSNEQKHELLRANGVHYDALPAWHKRGYAVLWETYAKEGFNPLTGQNEAAARNQLQEDFELPCGGAYSEWLETILEPKS